MTYHIHVHCSSSDCDGPHEHSHVITELRGAKPTNPAKMWRRALRLYLPHYAECDVKIRLHADDINNPNVGQPSKHGWLVADITQRTDEGGVHETLRGCYDESCDLNARDQRDVFAERMGY